MDKRYQVFVSSTYQDLHDERQEVMQALLELDCIPSGMELFPAANEDQWTLIKKVIDDSDYYLVIVGGRYGSLGPDGMSYTEMEYRYALDHGKPIVAFLHKEPGILPANRTEESELGRKKLKSFRELTERKMVKYWTTSSDLGSIVSRSLVVLIKTNPAVGWVRADRVPDESASQEILNLRKQIDIYEKKLKNISVSAPEGIENLAQGEDSFVINYQYEIEKSEDKYDIHGTKGKYRNDNISMTWNEIFSIISPLMINEVGDSDCKEAIKNKVYSLHLKRSKESSTDRFHFNVYSSDYETIIIQLRALGLIQQSIKKNRSVRSLGRTYWTLTPYGDTIMTKLRAIKRADCPSNRS